MIFVINRSLNDVLSRTLLTSITTMLAVAAMYFVAGGVIQDFAFTLGIGVLVGTYSSIFVASPLVLFGSFVAGQGRPFARLRRPSLISKGEAKKA